MTVTERDHYSHSPPAGGPRAGRPPECHSQVWGKLLPPPRAVTSRCSTVTVTDQVPTRKPATVTTAAAESLVVPGQMPVPLPSQWPPAGLAQEPGPPHPGTRAAAAAAADSVRAGTSGAARR